MSSLELLLEALVTPHTLDEWEYMSQNPSKKFTGIELLLFDAVQRLTTRSVSDWVDACGPKLGKHPRTGEDISDSDPVTLGEAQLFLLAAIQDRATGTESATQQTLGKLQKQDLVSAARDPWWPRDESQMRALSTFVFEGGPPPGYGRTSNTPPVLDVPSRTKELTDGT